MRWRPGPILIYRTDPIWNDDCYSGRSPEHSNIFRFPTGRFCLKFFLRTVIMVNSTLKTYSFRCAVTGETFKRFTITNVHLESPCRMNGVRARGRRGSIPRDDEGRRCSFSDYNADVELARVLFSRRCSLGTADRRKSLNSTTEVHVKSSVSRKMFKTSQKRPKEAPNSTCDIVKSGYAKIKSRKFKIWQKKWLVFHRASSLGPCRMEKYSDEKSALKEYHGKSFHLKNLEMIEKLPPRGDVHKLKLILRDGGSREIAFENESEADSWMNVIMKECLGSIYSGKPDLLASGVQKDLQEIFPVYLQASQETNMEGECYLQVTPEHIYIWDAEEPKLKLLAWPLTALRRYGYDKTKFTLESGRHCTTGEGLFTFRTSEGEEIYRKVHGATLSIAKSHHRQAAHIASRYSVNKFCVPNR